MARYDDDGNLIAENAPQQRAAYDDDGRPTRPRIRKRGPDGAIFEFAPDTSEQEQIRYAREYYQRKAPGYQAARRDAENIEGARRNYNPLSGTPLKFIGDASNAVGEFTDQMVANLGVNDEIAGAAAATATFLDNTFGGGGNIEDQIRGRERYSPGDAFNAAADVERERAQRYRQERPIADGFATAAGIAVSGKPAMGPRQVRIGPNIPITPANSMVAQAPIRANPFASGARVAAVNAPFAVARQEGDLVDRLPEAAIETVATALFATGGQAVSNALTSRAAPQVARLQDFEAAGVRPTFAAVGGNGAASITKAVAENPIAGVRARAALQNSIDDTSAAATRIADDIGTPGPTSAIGERIQEGVTRYARQEGPALGGRPIARFASAASTPTHLAGSFSAKSSQLYDAAFDRLNAIEARRIADGQGSQVILKATDGALRSIQGRVSTPGVAGIVNDPLVGRIGQALAEDRSAIRLGDIRALRTWVREAQRNPQLRQGIDDASLQRIESALTDDIAATVRNLGKNADGAARSLQMADRYYRAGMDRIKNALQPFADAKSGESAYQRVITAAKNGATGDVQRLLSLKRSLSPEDWNDLAATIVRNLGNPTKGAANVMEEGAFSVNTFLSNYAALSPRGRAILFASVGGGGSRADDLHNSLETLARVAGMQKAVEAAANRSNSSVAGQSVAMLGGLVTAPVQTLSIVGGLGITGEMMTNPQFVRWLASVPGAGQNVGGIRRLTAVLGQMASANPALQPFNAEWVKSMVPEAPQPQRAPAPQITQQAPQPQQFAPPPQPQPPQQPPMDQSAPPQATPYIDPYTGEPAQ